jgi:hypothetical protein
MMRQTMIQGYNMNSVGVIAPDVTASDISEFTQVDEMARIGETTANRTVANLHKMLSRLDSTLFGDSGEGGH